MTIKLYVVNMGKTPLAIYTKKEDADYFAAEMNKRDKELHSPQFGWKSIWRAPESQRTKYEVRELFPDCYVSKLRAGYSTYRIVMRKDGTIVEEKEVHSNPSLMFGWKSKSIQPDYTDKTLTPPNIPKIMVYSGLHKNMEEARAECDRLRIKSLLDDVWNTNRN